MSELDASSRGARFWSSPGISARLKVKQEEDRNLSRPLEPLNPTRLSLPVVQGAADSPRLPGAPVTNDLRIPPDMLSVIPSRRVSTADDAQREVRSAPTQRMRPGSVPPRSSVLSRLKSHNVTTTRAAHHPNSRSGTSCEFLLATLGITAARSSLTGVLVTQHQTKTQSAGDNCNPIRLVFPNLSFSLSIFLVRL